MAYNDYFHTHTGYDPYLFQEKVANAILRGKNVILRAPTGSGKTFASALPYFYTKSIGKNIADKLIYSVPFRSLGSSIANVIRGIDPNTVYHDGNHNEDMYFENEVIVTTIDQTLSAYLGYPFNVESPRNYNITRGSFVGSLLIFDEFHLYDLENLGRTTLDLIHRLNGVCQWVIMSATISDAALQFLRTLPNTEVIELTISEQKMVNHNRIKHIAYTSVPMNAETIIQKPGKSIVICNTVARSQAMYRALCTAKTNMGTAHQIILLHSRFIESDRSLKETDIQNIFGKDSPTDVNAILVATQTIEAGMDISCRYLYTDLAPMNALIQRIGRCARFVNEEGWITIYDITDEKGSRYILPYHGEKEVIDRTGVAIQTCTEITIFEMEVELINLVYHNVDKSAYDRIWRDLPIRDLYTELFTHHNHTQTKYIRNILSTNVAVINESDDYTHVRQTVSLPPYIIHHHLKNITGIVQYGWIRTQEKTKDDDEWQITYTYTPLTSENISVFTTTYPYYVLLFTTVASYDADYGLVIGSDRHTPTPVATLTPKIREPYKYLLEPYYFHAEAVADTIITQANNTVAIQKLCTYYKIPKSDMIRYLEYLGKYHDIGKLNLPCQNHFHTQQIRTNPTDPAYDPKEYYAHSYFDSSIHEKAKNPITHSYQSAFLSALILKVNNVPNPMVTLLCFAIAKHHSSNDSPDTTHLGDIVLDPTKIQRLYAKLNANGFTLATRYPKDRIQSIIHNLLTDRICDVRSTYFPLLLYFQRVLRLGDWNALKYMQSP